MAAGTLEIAIQPFGQIAHGPLLAIAAGLERAFGFRADVRESKQLPPTAWMAQRKQYDSTHLILFLESCAKPGDFRILGVCDRDIASPIMTFVFGEAEIDGRFAVLSLHRLRQEVYGMPANDVLFCKRAAKVAIHEIGHTLGLRHCFRSHCVMYPADAVEITDIKTEEFCPSCSEKLKAARTPD